MLFPLPRALSERLRDIVRRSRDIDLGHNSPETQLGQTLLCTVVLQFVLFTRVTDKSTLISNAEEHTPKHYLCRTHCSPGLWSHFGYPGH